MLTEIGKTNVTNKTVRDIVSEMLDSDDEELTSVSDDNSDSDDLTSESDSDS